MHNFLGRQNIIKGRATRNETTLLVTNKIMDNMLQASIQDFRNHFVRNIAKGDRAEIRLSILGMRVTKVLFQVQGSLEELKK